MVARRVALTFPHLVGRRPKCGVGLSQVTERVRGLWDLSFFADNTLRQIQSSSQVFNEPTQGGFLYCVRAGAKLNADKTRTLEVGPAPAQQLPAAPPTSRTRI